MVERPGSACVSRTREKCYCRSTFLSASRYRDDDSVFLSFDRRETYDDISLSQPLEHTLLANIYILIPKSTFVTSERQLGL